MRDSFKELCLGKPRKVFLLYLSISRKEISSELKPETLIKMRERLDSCLKILEDAFERGMRENLFIKHDASEASQALWAVSIGLSQMMQSEVLMNESGLKSKTDIPALYDTITGKFFESIFIEKETNARS